MFSSGLIDVDDTTTQSFEEKIQIQITIKINDYQKEFKNCLIITDDAHSNSAPSDEKLSQIAPTGSN